MASFMWKLVKINKSWVPPLEFIYPTSGIWYKDQFYQYVFILYYTIMAFGRNEFAPSTTIEVNLVIIVIVHFCWIYDDRIKYVCGLYLWYDVRFDLINEAKIERV